MPKKPAHEAESVIRSASHRVTNQVIERLILERITPDSRILDFGAGRGHMCQRLGRWFKSKGVTPRERISACEIVPEEFEYRDVDCQRIGTDCRIPAESTSQDVVLAVEVLEHLPRPYDFMAEAARVLKPGGWVVLSLPNILHLVSRFQFLTCGFGQLFGPPSVEPRNAGRICGHIMPLSIPYLAYGLGRTGFEEIEFHADRVKRGALAASVALWPLLKLASWITDRELRRYDESVWAANRWLVWRVNQLDMLSSRSCIVVARRDGVPVAASEVP